jgi:hypothetical protein
MSDVVLAEHPKNTNGTANATESPTLTPEMEGFLRELDQLARRWNSLDRDDLALRHETGALLNRFYGEPTARQPRGREAMKQAGRRLRKTEAELSQLRRFAHLFPSLAEFKQRRPDVTNWTQARALLPRLSQGGGGGGRATRAAHAERLRAVVRPLTRLTAAFRQLATELTAEEQEQLRPVLAAFVQAVPDCLRSGW